MALHMRSTIARTDIAAVRVLKAGKVFLLVGPAGDRVVIKQDSGVSRSHYKSVRHAVKAVDPSARMKILKPAELSALAIFAIDMERLAEYHGEDEVAAARGLREAVRGAARNPIVKMHAQKVLSIEDAIVDLGRGNRGGIRAFARALRGKGLTQFGEIIAVDLFNQNSDRFSPVARPMNRELGGFTFRLQVCVNVGNVLAIAESGGFRMSALDAADPSAYGHQDISASLAHSERADDWFGRVLVNPVKRLEYAGKIVDDLEAMLHPKRTALRIRRLGSKKRAMHRLDTGIVMGGRKILAHLTNKTHGGRNAMPGMRDRLKLLQQLG
ncbi:MAG: hypothetical protein AB8G99_15735 [Planctomycetaceae bacterium]